MDPFKYSLTFKREVEGTLYVTHQPSIKFFVSRSIRWEDEFLAEPLTISRFIRAIVMNLFSLNYWKVMRVLIRRLHAFELSEGEVVLWRKFKPYLAVHRWIKDFASLFEIPESDLDKDSKPKSDEEFMALYRAFQSDMNDMF